MLIYKELNLGMVVLIGHQKYKIIGLENENRVNFGWWLNGKYNTTWADWNYGNEAIIVPTNWKERIKNGP